MTGEQLQTDKLGSRQMRYWREPGVSSGDAHEMLRLRRNIRLDRLILASEQGPHQDHNADDQENPTADYRQVEILTAAEENQDAPNQKREVDQQWPPGQWLAFPLENAGKQPHCAKNDQADGQDGIAESQGADIEHGKYQNDPTYDQADDTTNEHHIHPLDHATPG